MLSAQPGRNNPEPVDYNPDEFWLRTLLRWYIGLVIRPVPTIREIVERRPLLAGLGTVVCVSMILEGLSEVLYSNRDFSNRDSFLATWKPLRLLESEHWSISYSLVCWRLFLRLLGISLAA